jgi:hypothetical protein
LVVSYTTLVYGQENANSLDFGATGILSMSNDLIGVGPGAAVSWYNTKLYGPLGMGAYLQAMFPFVEDNWGMALSLLTGPSYMIIDKGVFAIPVTAGIHFDFVHSFLKELSAINLGAGVAFDFVWRFGQMWHAYARIAAAYNFGAGGEFLVFPSLGAGISF